MDKQKLREAMKAVTAGVGRKPGVGGGGASAEALRGRLAESLVTGSRTTKAGKVVQYSAANTVRMAARLLAAGGTVPEVTRTRYSFALAIPALREMATVMGCDADALVAALVAPAAEPVADPEEMIPGGASEQAAAEAQPVVRVVGGSRRRS